MKILQKEIESQSYLKITPSDKYTYSITNLEKLIESAKATKKLIKIGIFSVIGIAILIFSYPKYVKWAEEAEREAKIEEQRRTTNINRVENLVFVRAKVEKISDSLIKLLNSESIDITKEDYYISKYSKLLDEKIEKLNSDIKDICEMEAGKETEAIEMCTKNNMNHLDSTLHYLKPNLIIEIKKTISDIKFLERNEEIQELVKPLQTKLNQENITLSQYNSKSDDYIIDGKSIPASLQKSIYNSKQEIANYEHKIQHYKNIMQSDSFEITAPTDLKNNAFVAPTKKKSTVTKTIISAPSTPKTVKTEVTKKAPSNDTNLEIKKLQEQIDDIYIDGGTPDKSMLDKLNQLKQL